ncbi:MAG: L-sorbosone dehydrogenase [Myxococcaceae bacterium]|nr:L-sorbosone dehydrogenase [Myxococcaceae bacterium]
MALSRQRRLVFIAFILGAVGAGAVSSCSKDQETVPAAPDGGTEAAPSATGTLPPAVGADSGPGIATKPDAAVPLSIAKGDPCRGLALPPDQLFVPAGMCPRVVASDIGAARQLTFAPNGDLFVALSSGVIQLFRDANGDGVFDPSEIHDWATTLDDAGTTDSGNNVHIAGTFLYAGSPAGVKRWPYLPGALSGGIGEDVVIGQPPGGHPKHTVHVFDGFLYVMSGSAANAEASGPAYDTNRALLRRFDLATFAPGTPLTWLAGEVVTVGIRNMVGFTQNAAGHLWGVVNGIDGASYAGTDVQQDNPGEQVVELGLGRKYGFPFCFTAQKVMTTGGLVPPGTQLAFDQVALHDDAWCAANAMKPATFVQAHSAPLEILFFELQPQGVLPERWRGGAFVTLHGSSYRTVPTGFKVVWLPFDATGVPPMPKVNAAGEIEFPYETVFGRGTAAGPIDGSWSWNVNGAGESSVRPVGIAISPVDGALYISSDNGHLYRVGLVGSGK